MSAKVIEFRTFHPSAMRNIERVWQLRAQVLEHVRAIEELCEQMEGLPHVWGILPDQVGQYLDNIEPMLTPDPLDKDEEKEWGAEDLREWQEWQAFQKAKGISL